MHDVPCSGGGTSHICVPSHLTPASFTTLFTSLGKVRPCLAHVRCCDVQLELLLGLRTHRADLISRDAACADLALQKLLSNPSG
ncbi:hypothetical protein OAO87_04475 [bacterium]|nr:hypothetical protein [bacterium]